MIDWIFIKHMVFGLEHAQPGGLVLTWVLFLGTLGLSLSAAYGLSCVSYAYRSIGIVAAATFRVFRGIPPLIIIFAVDFLVPGPLLVKAILTLTLYSASHLYPVFADFLMRYPEHLLQVEHVLRIGCLRRYLVLRMHWVGTRALPAVHTHLISLFKDTSIVIIIGMLELAAITKLLASRTYDLSEWIWIFLTCALLYFINVQIVSVLCIGARKLLSHSRMAILPKISGVQK